MSRITILFFGEYRTFEKNNTLSWIKDNPLIDKIIFSTLSLSAYNLPLQHTKTQHNVPSPNDLQCLLRERFNKDAEVIIESCYDTWSHNTPKMFSRMLMGLARFLCGDTAEYVCFIRPDFLFNVDFDISLLLAHNMSSVSMHPNFVNDMFFMLSRKDALDFFTFLSKILHTGILRETNPHIVLFRFFKKRTLNSLYIPPSSVLRHNAHGQDVGHVYREMRIIEWFININMTKSVNQMCEEFGLDKNEIYDIFARYHLGHYDDHIEFGQVKCELLFV